MGRISGSAGLSGRISGPTRYVPDFIVVGRQLVQELLDPVLFAEAVDVGDLVLRDCGKVEVHLEQKRAMIFPFF